MLLRIFADNNEANETLEAVLSLAECGDDRDYYYYDDHFRHKRRKEGNVDSKAQEGSVTNLDSEDSDEDDGLVDGYWSQEEYLAIKAYYENEEQVDRDVMTVFAQQFIKVSQNKRERVLMANQGQESAAVTKGQWRERHKVKIIS